MEREYDFLPWKIEDRNTQEQLRHQAMLGEAYGLEFGENCYASPLAELYDVSGRIGPDTVVGAGALIRSADIRTGRNCSINTYAYLQGKIVMGDDVRIGPKASIIAHNHGHFDITLPITSQPCTAKGITIGSDVWIGANSVITDGVTVGSHSIIGAGSVVTKDVPDYVIVGGNPARVIRNRVETYFAEKLARFCDTAASQIGGIVRSHISEGSCTDPNAPDRNPNRAWCDAVELLTMFPSADMPVSKETLAEKVRELQQDRLDYNVLCLGYCLENLNDSFRMPFSCAAELAGDRLVAFLEDLTWKNNAWLAGAMIDSLGTAFYHNKKYFHLQPDLDTLFRWLDDHCPDAYGMWGNPENRHDMVNGFYRLTRGTYAQFGRALPNPERAIDTVLSHAATITPGSGLDDACNVLDIIHPLWLARRQTDHRSREGKELAIGWIDRILESWSDGKGFSFLLSDPGTPSLMGTEMWLSILYLLCDYLGISGLLNYEPKGVHRLYTEI